jgi:hypothetical protein
MRRQRLLAGVLWLHHRRKTINAWVVRGVSFYFGYKILDHEIYGAGQADPLLVFLGLWLCGIAPATFFDGVRRIAAGASTEPDRREESSNNELKSGDKQ